jgi:hypothetical protein
VISLHTSESLPADGAPANDRARWAINAVFFSTAIAFFLAACTSAASVSRPSPSPAPSSMLSITPVPDGLTQCQGLARAGVATLDDLTALLVGETTEVEYKRQAGPVFSNAKQACLAFLPGTATPQLDACATVGTLAWDAALQTQAAFVARTNREAEAHNARGTSDLDAAGAAWPLCFPGASLPPVLQPSP